MKTNRILLVEDDPVDAELATRRLGRMPIPVEVVVAKDGVEALHLLYGGNGKLPDLVLLDLHLPKLNGLAVLRRIRAEEATKRLPVVMLTSSSEEKDKVEAYAGGATKYITKGYDAKAFANAVAEAVQMLD
jgi:CheY-like chemotaxis protein